MVRMMLNVFRALRRVINVDALVPWLAGNIHALRERVSRLDDLLITRWRSGRSLSSDEAHKTCLSPFISPLYYKR